MGAFFRATRRKNEAYVKAKKRVKQVEKKHLLVGLFILFLLCACASTGAVKTGGQKGSTVIVLQSNQATEWYIDSQLVGRGRRLETSVTNAPHHVVAKAKEYKEKEEYINPPYSKGEQYSFFFMIEDKLEYKTAWGKTKEDLAREKDETAETPVIAEPGRLYGTIQEWVTATGPSLIQNVERSKPIAIYGFLDKKTGERMQMSVVLEDCLTQECVNQGFCLVNRRQLDAVLAEQQLSLSEIVKEGEVKIGELTGAFYVLSGRFCDNPSEGVILVHLLITRVSDGVVVKVVNGKILRNASNLSLLKP